MSNEVIKKPVADPAVVTANAKPTAGKVAVATKGGMPEVKILARLEATGKDSILETITNMTGDPDFGKKFVTYTKIAVQNAWKRDKVSGKWTNPFSVVPLESILQCLYSAARRKILPDGYNAYLVAYTGKDPRCQLLIDYKGLVDTAIAEGIFEDVGAEMACENDEIAISFGEVTRFDIDPKRERGAAIGCVAWGILPSGRRKTIFVTMKDLEKIHDCAQTEEVWGNWGDEMYKKSAIRRLFKTARNSPRLNAMMAQDNEAFDLTPKETTASEPRRLAKESPVRAVAGDAPAMLAKPEAEAEEAEPVEAEAELESVSVF